MGESVLVQLGIGGVFAIIIIDRFVAMIIKLKGTKNNGNGDNGHNQICKDTKEVAIDTNDKVKTLHSLHNKTTPDGLPVWYFPQSIVQDQKEIAKAQTDTAIHLKALAESVRILSEKQRR